MTCPKCGAPMSYTGKDEYLQEVYVCRNGHTAIR